MSAIVRGRPTVTSCASGAGVRLDDARRSSERLAPDDDVGRGQRPARRGPSAGRPRRGPRRETRACRCRPGALHDRGAPCQKRPTYTEMPRGRRRAVASPAHVTAPAPRPPHRRRRRRDARPRRRPRVRLGVAAAVRRSPRSPTRTAARPALVVAGDDRQARDLAADLRAWLHPRPVRFYPSRGVAYESHLAPPPHLVGLRVAALDALLDDEQRRRRRAPRSSSSPPSR